MSLFCVIALFASLPDLVRIADAVADRTRPGRHAAVWRTGHAAMRVR